MKCLCCDEVFNNQYFLKDYYANSHSVDENNYFFRKVFTGSLHRERVFDATTIA